MGVRSCALRVLFRRVVPIVPIGCWAGSWAVGVGTSSGTIEGTGVQSPAVPGLSFVFLDVSGTITGATAPCTRQGHPGLVGVHGRPRRQGVASTMAGYWRDLGF